MRKLTILFDADDVAENLCDCWIEMLNERYGTSVTLKDVQNWDMTKAFPTLTKEQVFDVLHTDEIWKRITPLPGAVEVLQKLHNEGMNSTWLRHLITVPASQRWIAFWSYSPS